MRGENFLEYKREQLIFQIRKYNQDYLNHRKQFLDDYRKVLIQLNKIYKEMGKKSFRLISNISQIQYSPTININYIKQYGISIPKIKFELMRKEKLPSYSFDNTSHYLDELIVTLKDFFEKLLSLAEKEDLMLNFSFNYNKINRRINALKNIIIPEFITEIKKIKEIMEEIDRENFVRLKKTRDLINKKQKIA
jgi:V/A-type H+-transporting ATPase subunit D